MFKPAIYLMIWGGMLVLLALFYLFLSFAHQNTPGQRAEQRLAAIVLLCCGGSIISGSVMMKSLRSYGLAMTVSITCVW